MHFVAALRMAASAAGWGEATAAAASTQGISPDLPHPDTLQGLVWFESGACLLRCLFLVFMHAHTLHALALRASPDHQPPVPACHPPLHPLQARRPATQW